MFTIKITYIEPNKLKSNILIKQSALISAPYNADLVAFLRNLRIRAYIPETGEWEVPASEVSGLCKTFNTARFEIIGSVLEKKSNSVSIPTGFSFKTKPFRHQIDGVLYGLEKERFLLCDDQGLGKTKQIIDLAGCLQVQDPSFKKVLIICGVNSLKYNWANEIEKHSNNSAYVLGTRYRKNGKMIEGSSKDKLEDLDHLPDCKYIITNIETLRAGAEKVSSAKYSFPVAERVKNLCTSGEISMIAFDECHKAKNPTSLQGRAMLKTSAKYMVAMSGTPLMNNPLDLYFSLRWLGYENHSYYMFKQHYCLLGGFGGAEVVGYKNLDELKDILSGVMLRRLKTEVLDLPDKIHTEEFVDMTPDQSKIYMEVLTRIKREINKVRFSNNPLSMLIRLRQATGWTGLLSDTIQESAKINRLMELLEELASSDKKCLVYSNWSAITEVVLKLLKKYNPAYITGQTKPEERMIEVNKLQNDPSCKVLIGTIGAMGTGLTLTAAQTVIFLDEPWNRALKDQAEDRAHRIGTAGTVNIITLICKNTIDERISNIVYKKGALSDMIVDNQEIKINESILQNLLE